MNPIPFENTFFGFKWGGLKVTRVFEDKKSGAVWLEVISSRGLKTNQNAHTLRQVQVSASKSGLLRVFVDGVEIKWWDLKEIRSRKGEKK